MGPAAIAQLEAQGVKVSPPKGQGRYRRSPAEERTVDGRVFDSKLEARIYESLKRAIGADNVTCQPEFELLPAFTDVSGKKQRATHYVADFLVKLPDGEHVLDAKGHLTEVFRLKQKFFLHRYQRPLHKIYSVEQLTMFLATHGV